jgi:hypothetical protein
VADLQLTKSWHLPILLATTYLLLVANYAFSFKDIMLHLYICVNLLSVAMFCPGSTRILGPPLERTPV